MAYRDGYQVCAPWVDPETLCCAGEQQTTDCETGEPVAMVFPASDEDYALAASNILYQRTGRRWPGVCEKTVWPCAHCRCNSNPCGCGCYHALVLGRDLPILSVELVELDGVPMATEDYRLDENQRLVRVDGHPWPVGNTMGLPCAGVSSAVDLRVTYTAGREAPPELVLAARELACELKRACNGDESCKLPERVRSVSRRGVNIELHDVAELLGSGMTGNAIIDHALEVHGRSRPAASFVDPLEVAANRSVRV